MRFMDTVRAVDFSPGAKSTSAQLAEIKAGQASGLTAKDMRSNARARAKGGVALSDAQRAELCVRGAVARLESSADLEETGDAAPDRH